MVDILKGLIGKKSGFRDIEKDDCYIKNAVDISYLCEAINENQSVVLLFSDDSLGKFVKIRVNRVREVNIVLRLDVNGKIPQETRDYLLRTWANNLGIDYHLFCEIIEEYVP